MAHDLCDDLELVAADGEYYYFDDDFGDGFPTASGGESGLQHEQMDDTSASDYKEGKDIQGIPWERLNYSRDQYREMRLKEYKNYQNLTRSRSGLEQECKQVERKDTFYDFHSSTRSVKSTIVHFQLRNLLWAASKHDVYLVQNYSVMHWSPLFQRGREVLNVAGQLTPTEDVKGARPLSRVQISTMALKDNLMVAGGFQGELICKYVDKPGVAFCTNLTGNNYSITNAVDIFESPDGATRVMAANNDCVVRTFDTARYSLLTQFTFPWSVNVSIRRRRIHAAALGNNPDTEFLTPAKMDAEHVGEPQRQADGGARRQPGLPPRRLPVGQGDCDAPRPPGLLVRVGVAPRRPRPGHGEPGRDVPAVGRPQPLRAARRAGRPDRRRPGPPVLPRRPVPGGGRGRRLRARVRRRGWVRRGGAGGGPVRRGGGRRVQPRRRGPVRQRRRPDIRRRARVPAPAVVRLPRLVLLLRCPAGRPECIRLLCTEAHCFCRARVLSGAACISALFELRSGKVPSGRWFVYCMSGDECRHFECGVLGTVACYRGIVDDAW
ncbi:hypothetical protein SEVIR_9G386801v4 [Setaria viridis]